MLDEIRHFVLIAEHGTFTAAARRAHLSQPALTASIQRLEEHFGARLLHRGPGGSELTAAGQALLPRARAALAAVEEGRRAVAEVEGLQAGVVSLGAGATACTYLLPPILAEFRARYPGLGLRLREGFTEQTLRDLQDGEIDLGIITGDGTGDGEHWREDELIVVAAPSFDPCRREFVTFPEGSPTRALLLRHFEDVEIVMELSSIAAVKGNVRAGMGMALLSRTAVDIDLQLGRLVEVCCPQTPITRRLAIVHRGLERLPPAAAALRELLLDACAVVATR